eukprot:392468_1
MALVFKCMRNKTQNNDVSKLFCEQHFRQMQESQSIVHINNEQDPILHNRFGQIMKRINDTHYEIAVFGSCPCYLEETYELNRNYLTFIGTANEHSSN